MKPDINCDMGEGIGNDELIMPFITSANIACGYHAGDADTMRKTIKNCMENDVAIGVHISFNDRKNFGRKEINLSASDLNDLVFRQLDLFYNIAEDFGVKPVHVKPHGALYNMSAKDPFIATIVASAIEHFDSSLLLFGLSGSHSIDVAKTSGLKTFSEVFADRTYQDDGSLTPRSQPGALIENTEESIQQLLQMINEGTVTTITGKTIPIVAETICIHSDGKHAVEFAKAIHKVIHG